MAGGPNTEVGGEGDGVAGAGARGFEGVEDFAGDGFGRLAEDVCGAGEGADFVAPVAGVVAGEGGFAVGETARMGFADGAAAEGGGDGAGLDEGDGYAGGGELHAPLVAQGFDGEFAGAIGAHEGDGHASDDGGEEDDATGALGAEGRNQAGGEVGGAEDVGFELAAATEEESESSRGSGSKPSARRASRSSGRRAVGKTVQPRSRRRRAVARPMPEEAPVTRTVLEGAGG